MTKAAIATLLAERDCARLTYRYCRAADLCAAARIAEVFTDDGVFALADRTLTGRAEIARHFTARQALTDLQTVHLCTNIDIELTGADEAHGWVYVCLFRRWRDPAATTPIGNTTPALVGIYEDRYARRHDSWLIAHRAQRVLFADPADTGWTRPDGADGVTA